MPYTLETSDWRRSLEYYYKSLQPQIKAWPLLFARNVGHTLIWPAKEKVHKANTQNFRQNPQATLLGILRLETPWLAARLLPLLAIINVTIDISILVTNYYCY